MFIKKGTHCFIEDGQGNSTNQSISIDKDRELDINDIFTWGEDEKQHYRIDFKVVGFADFMPVIVEIMETE